jgi:hypothetical protein
MRVNLEKLIVAYLTKKSHILWKPIVHYRVHKNTILIQMNQVLILKSVSSKSVLILPSHLRLDFPSDLFLSVFPTELPFLAFTILNAKNTPIMQFESFLLHTTRIPVHCSEADYLRDKFGVEILRTTLSQMACLVYYNEQALKIGSRNLLLSQIPKVHHRHRKTPLFDLVLSHFNPVYNFTTQSTNIRSVLSSSVLLRPTGGFIP